MINGQLTKAGKIICFCNTHWNIIWFEDNKISFNSPEEFPLNVGEHFVGADVTFSNVGLADKTNILIGEKNELSVFACKGMFQGGRGLVSPFFALSSHSLSM